MAGSVCSGAVVSTCGRQLQQSSIASDMVFNMFLSYFKDAWLPVFRKVYLGVGGWPPSINKNLQDLLL